MNNEYFIDKQEQVVEQFPDLVRTLGYMAAFEEMTASLTLDELLHPEDVATISEKAAYEYLNSTMPDNIIRGTE